MERNTAEPLREFADDMTLIVCSSCFMGEYEAKELRDDIEKRLRTLIHKLMPTLEDEKAEINKRLRYAESMGYSYKEVVSLKYGLGLGIRYVRNKMKGGKK